MSQRLNSKQIAAIRRLHLTEKWPLKQVARHLRFSLKTIKKYVFSPDRPPGSPQHRISKLDSYKPAIIELLQRDFTVKFEAMFQHIRSMGYQGGKRILRDYVQRIRTKPSGPSITGIRQEAFDWMRAVLQGEGDRDSAPIFGLLDRAGVDQEEPSKGP